MFSLLPFVSLFFPMRLRPPMRSGSGRTPHVQIEEGCGGPNKTCCKMVGCSCPPPLPCLTYALDRKSPMGSMHSLIEHLISAIGQHTHVMGTCSGFCRCRVTKHSHRGTRLFHGILTLPSALTQPSAQVRSIVMQRVWSIHACTVCCS